jgi:hypothetical protein
VHPVSDAAATALAAKLGVEGEHVYLEPDIELTSRHGFTPVTLTLHTPTGILVSAAIEGVQLPVHALADVCESAYVEQTDTAWSLAGDVTEPGDGVPVGERDPAAAGLLQRGVPFVGSMWHLLFLLHQLTGVRSCAAIVHTDAPTYFERSLGEGGTRSGVDATTGRLLAARILPIRGVAVGVARGLHAEAVAVFECDTVAVVGGDPATTTLGGLTPASSVGYRLRHRHCSGVATNAHGRCAACQLFLSNSIKRLEYDAASAAAPTPVSDVAAVMQLARQQAREMSDDALEADISRRVSVPLTARTAAQWAHCLADVEERLRRTQQQCDEAVDKACRLYARLSPTQQKACAHLMDDTFEASDADAAVFSFVATKPAFREFVCKYVADQLSATAGSGERALPSEVVELIVLQLQRLRDGSRLRHGRRYPPALLKLALQWLDSSPNLYRDLATLLALPSVKHLQRYRSAFRRDSEDMTMRNAIRLFAATAARTRNGVRNGHVPMVMCCDGMYVRKGLLCDSRGNVVGGVDDLHIPAVTAAAAHNAQAERSGTPAAARAAFDVTSPHPARRLQMQYSFSSRRRAAPATAAEPEVALATQVIVVIITGMECAARTVAAAMLCDNSAGAGHMSRLVLNVMRECARHSIYPAALVWDGAGANERATTDMAGAKHPALPVLHPSQLASICVNPYLAGAPPCVILTDPVHMYKRVRNLLLASRADVSDASRKQMLVPVRDGVIAGSGACGGSGSVAAAAAPAGGVRAAGAAAGSGSAAASASPPAVEWCPAAWDTFVQLFEQDLAENTYARALAHVSRADLQTDNAGRMREGPAKALCNTRTVAALRSSIVGNTPAGRGLAAYVAVFSDFVDAVLSPMFCTSLTAWPVKTLLSVAQRLADWRALLVERGGEADVKKHFIHRQLFENVMSFVAGVVALILLHCDAATFNSLGAQLSAPDCTLPFKEAIRAALPGAQRVRATCPAAGSGMGIRLVRLNQNPAEHFFRSVRQHSGCSHPTVKAAMDYIARRAACGGVVVQRNSTWRQQYLDHDAEGSETYDLTAGSNPLLYQKSLAAPLRLKDAGVNVLASPLTASSSADAAPRTGTSAVLRRRGMFAGGAGESHRGAVMREFVLATLQSVSAAAAAGVDVQFIKDLSNGGLCAPQLPWQQWTADVMYAVYTTLTPHNWAVHGRRLLPRVVEELRGTGWALEGLAAILPTTSGALLTEADVEALFVGASRKLVMATYRQHYKTDLSMLGQEAGGTSVFTLRQHVRMAGSKPTGAAAAAIAAVDDTQRAAATQGDGRGALSQPDAAEMAAIMLLAQPTAARPPSAPAGRPLAAVAARPPTAPGAVAVRPVAAPGAAAVRPVAAPGAAAVRPLAAPVALAVRPPTAPGAAAVRPPAAPGAAAVRPLAAPLALAARPPAPSRARSQISGGDDTAAAQTRVKRPRQLPSA